MQTEATKIIIKHIESAPASWGPLFIILQFNFNNHMHVFEELLGWVNDLQKQLGFCPVFSTNVVKISSPKNKSYTVLDDYCKYSWLNEMRRFVTVLFSHDIINDDFYILFNKFLKNEMLHHIELFTPEMKETYKQALESTLEDRIVTTPMPDSLKNKLGI